MVFDDVGTLSAIINWNTEKASRTVTPRETFSPESGAWEVKDDENQQGHHHTRHHDVDQVVEDSSADVDGDHYLQIDNTSCHVQNAFQNYKS